jgi:prepilin-type N-terminal cleavage/methylation domain-containing protein
MSTRGFSLIELMVVLAIIAAAAAFVLGRRNSSASAAALRSAQVELANAIALARMRAITSGQSARVLIQVDPSSAVEPRRFLRRVAVQEFRGSIWQSVGAYDLPTGVYILPGNFSSLPAGLFVPGEESGWVRSDNSSPLRSTALRASMIVSEAIDSDASEQWVSIVLSGVGSTAQGGDLVLAAGDIRPPGSFVAGDSPIQLRNPNGVLGLTLSTYGVTALVHDRVSF